MLDLHHLPNATSDEQIIFFLRRHPITLINIIVGYTFIILFPFIFWFGIGALRPDLLESDVSKALIVLGGSAFFLFCWLFLFQSFLDYYLDMWVVTNRRILNIEQTGLFARTISELRLYRIQDVTSKVQGMIATFFNYGNVEIQTAGEHDFFNFEQIPNPTFVAKTILEYAEKDRHENLDSIMDDLESGTGKPAATTKPVTP